MDIGLYAIYDSKAQGYLTPVTAKTDAVAVRMFQQAVSDPSTDFNKWHDDYSLFLLGHFNDDTGALIPLNAPKVLITGTQIAALIKKEN